MLHIDPIVGMNHTHVGERIIIIYIDSYEILAFKIAVQKHEKNTQRVRDSACVTNNLGGGYGPVFLPKGWA